VCRTVNGPATGKAGLADKKTDVLVRHDCTRTQPAIFAIYMQSSKQPFDSPCNLRTSHAVHHAIFAPHAAGRSAILRDGPSLALILVVTAVLVGSSARQERPPEQMLWMTKLEALTRVA
jgi:hypothetical protein